MEIDTKLMLQMTSIWDKIKELVKFNKQKADAGKQTEN